jgi:hypothetical protein
MNQANPQNTPTKMENTPSYNNKMQEETTQEIERVYSLKGAIEKNHAPAQIVPWPIRLTIFLTIMF